MGKGKPAVNKKPANNKKSPAKVEKVQESKPIKKVPAVKIPKKKSPAAVPSPVKAIVNVAPPAKKAAPPVKKQQKQKKGNKKQQGKAKQVKRSLTMQETVKQANEFLKKEDEKKLKLQQEKEKAEKQAAEDRKKAEAEAVAVAAAKAKQAKKIPQKKPVAKSNNNNNKNKKKPTLPAKKALKRTKTMLETAQEAEKYLENEKRRIKKAEDEKKAAAAVVVAPLKMDKRSKKIKKVDAPVVVAVAPPAAVVRSASKEKVELKRASSSKSKDESPAVVAPVAEVKRSSSKAGAALEKKISKSGSKEKIQLEEQKIERQASKSKLQRQKSVVPKFGVIDVVFCCDTTGSMGSYLNQTKETIKTIIQTIKQRVVGTDVSVKFGFVAYRDHPPQDSTYVTKYHDLVYDVEIMPFINSLDANGGGDGPEAVMDGLMDAARKIKWRDTVEPSLRYIFHIADAPPHGTLYGGYSTNWKDGCPCKITIEQVSKVINMKSIHYRLIKVGNELNKMEEIFKNLIQDFEVQPINNAKGMDIKISDMIMRELIPDEAFDHILK